MAHRQPLLRSPMRVQVFHRSFLRAHLVAIVLTAFAVIGSTCLVGGAYLARDSFALLATAVRAEGRVAELEYQRSSDGGGTYKPVVRFRPEGAEEIEFRGTVGSNPPSFRKGEAVEVLYDPQAPERARINSFGQLWFVPVLLGVFGLVFGGIGWGYWIMKLITKRRDAWLTRHGRLIEAEIIDIGKDGAISFNRQTPWRIRAQWKDPAGSGLYVFNSRALWFDPAPLVKGKKIAILIDPRNPGRYRMDLAFAE
jgi:hypothetical protein